MYNARFALGTRNAPHFPHSKRKILIYIMTAVFMLCGVLMVIGRLSVCRLLKWDCVLGMDVTGPIMLPFEVGGVLLATEFSEVVT